MHDPHVLVTPESYELSSNGKVRIKPYFVPLERAIKFVFALFMRVNNISYKITYEDHRWRDLQDAIIARNRITHPKSPANLTITNEDIDKTKGGVDWFQEQLIKMQMLLHQKLSEENALLEAKLRQQNDKNTSEP